MMGIVGCHAARNAGLSVQAFRAARNWPHKNGSRNAGLVEGPDACKDC
jgi:hypothetical protein